MLLGLGEEEIDEVFEKVVEIGRLSVQLDFAGVAEEVVEDFAQAAGFLLDGLEAVEMRG